MILFPNFGVVLEPAHLDLVWSSVVSVFLLAGGAGALAGGPLAQRLGRKRALLADALLHAAGAALFAACRPANSVEMLLLGRLVAGLASGPFSPFPISILFHSIHSSFVET